MIFSHIELEMRNGTFGGGEGQRIEQALSMFRRRVKEMREERDLSQEEAARRAGISQSNWSKIERGPTTPSARQVLQIQMALNAESLELFFGSFPSASFTGTGDERGK